MRLAAAQRLRALRNAADLHTYRGPQPQCQQPAVHRDRAHSRVFATSLGISRSSASSTWRSREPWTDEDWSRASRGSESVSRLSHSLSVYNRVQWVAPPCSVFQLYAGQPLGLRDKTGAAHVHICMAT